MAPMISADRPIELRRDDSEEEYISDEDANEQPLEQFDRESQLGEDEDESSSEELNDKDSDQSDVQTTSDTSEDEDEDNEEAEDLKSISFGALAKAQATFTPPTKSRKRKLADNEDTTTQKSIDNAHPTPDYLSKKPKQDPSLTTRTSKHAPTILSSRNPVSRKRNIITPPPSTSHLTTTTSKLTHNDPRFNPAITSSTLNPQSTAAATKAYSFLTDYQATEILALKSEIAKVSRTSKKPNPQRESELKRDLMSLESRLRNTQTRNKEQEIVARHRREEKQAIREGKKARPYFLKKSDVRKEVERERVEGMGKKQRDKMEKRQRMRLKTKEAKDMPWARRMG